MRTFEEGYVSIDLEVDTKDAMGANILNTMLEAVAQEVRQLMPEADILFSILSNYATQSLIEAKCEISLEQLSPELAEKLFLRVNTVRSIRIVRLPITKAL